MQPQVSVSAPVRVITRSSSWHSMCGQPAVLKVKVRAQGNARSVQKGSSIETGIDDFKRHRGIYKSDRPYKHQQNPLSSSDRDLHLKTQSQCGQKKLVETFEPSPIPRTGSAAAVSYQKVLHQHNSHSLKRRRVGQSNAPNIAVLLKSMDTGDSPERSYGINSMETVKPKIFSPDFQGSAWGLTDSFGDLANRASAILQSDNGGRQVLSESCTFPLNFSTKHNKIPREGSPMGSLNRHPSGAHPILNRSKSLTEDTRTAYDAVKNSSSREKDINIGMESPNLSRVSISQTNGDQITLTTTESPYTVKTPNISVSSRMPTLQVEEHISVGGNRSRKRLTGLINSTSCENEQSCGNQENEGLVNIGSTSNNAGLWERKPSQSSRDLEISMGDRGIIMEEEEEEAVLGEIGHG